MSKVSAYAGLKWLWLSVFLCAADLWTKWLAVTHLTLYERVPVLPVFNLTLVYNQGAAFSMLSNQSGWQRWFLIAIAGFISTMIVVWLKRDPQTPLVHKIGLACILGGALGNALDRLRYGYVVDFIDVHFAGSHFPTFNIADSAITFGAVLLLLTLWRK